MITWQGVLLGFGVYVAACFAWFCFMALAVWWAGAPPLGRTNTREIMDGLREPTWKTVPPEKAEL